MKEHTHALAYILDSSNYSESRNVIHSYSRHSQRNQTKKKSVFVCSFWLMGMISSTNTALLLIVSKSHSQHEQVDYSSVT